MYLEAGLDAFRNVIFYLPNDTWTYARLLINTPNERLTVALSSERRRTIERVMVRERNDALHALYYLQGLEPAIRPLEYIIELTWPQACDRHMLDNSHKLRPNIKDEVVMPYREHTIDGRLHTLNICFRGEYALGDVVDIFSFNASVYSYKMRCPNLGLDITGLDHDYELFQVHLEPTAQAQQRDGFRAIEVHFAKMQE